MSDIETQQRQQLDRQSSTRTIITVLSTTVTRMNVAATTTADHDDDVATELLPGMVIAASPLPTELAATESIPMSSASLSPTSNGKKNAADNDAADNDSQDTSTTDNDVDSNDKDNNGNDAAAAGPSGDQVDEQHERDAVVETAHKEKYERNAVVDEKKHDDSVNPTASTESPTAHTASTSNTALTTATPPMNSDNDNNNNSSSDDDDDDDLDVLPEMPRLSLDRTSSAPRIEPPPPIDENSEVMVVGTPPETAPTQSRLPRSILKNSPSSSSLLLQQQLSNDAAESLWNPNSGRNSNTASPVTDAQDNSAGSGMDVPVNFRSLLSSGIPQDIRSSFSSISSALTTDSDSRVRFAAPPPSLKPSSSSSYYSEIVKRRKTTKRNGGGRSRRSGRR